MIETQKMLRELIQERMDLIEKAKERRDQALEYYDAEMIGQDANVERAATLLQLASSWDIIHSNTRRNVDELLIRLESRRASDRANRKANEELRRHREEKAKEST